jgi:hypothetical protein
MGRRAMIVVHIWVFLCSSSIDRCLKNQVLLGIRGVTPIYGFWTCVLPYIWGHFVWNTVFTPRDPKEPKIILLQQAFSVMTERTNTIAQIRCFFAYNKKRDWKKPRILLKLESHGKSCKRLNPVLCFWISFTRTICINHAKRNSRFRAEFLKVPKRGTNSLRESVGISQFVRLFVFAAGRSFCDDIALKDNLSYQT